MSEAWKQQTELDGGGLWAANVRLARLLRRRRIAYALLLAFPLGLHRAYLHDHRGAWLYRSLSAASLILALAGMGLASLAPLGAAALLAAYDAFQVENRLVALNKRLRMQVYLSQGQGAPQGFRGRYTDDDLADYLAAKEAERAGHGGREAPYGQGRRAPSFAQQEAMLRALARRKPEGDA